MQRQLKLADNYSKHVTFYDVCTVIVAKQLVWFGLGKKNKKHTLRQNTSCKFIIIAQYEFGDLSINTNY